MIQPHSLEPSTSSQLGPSARFRRKFMRELVAVGLPAGPGSSAIVDDADLETLPAPAQRYLRFMHVVGRPCDWSFCARWDGSFRMRPEEAWVPIEAWQYDTSLEVARIFHMRLNMRRLVPTYVRDIYAHGGGHMLGRILDRFAIVDDASDKIAIGELVTYMNDALVFAPSMLLGTATTWMAVDDDSFDIALTDHDTTVTGRVFVDAHGAMVDFSTTDRFGTDPANPEAGLVRTRWSTPVEGWTLAGDRRIFTTARAVWHFPSGDFCYAKMSAEKMNILFNVPPDLRAK